MGGVGWVWELQAVRTNGYVCETLVAAAGVCAQFLDLAEPAIGNGSMLMQLLTLPTLDGGAVPLTCTDNAASVLANFLRALSHNASLVAEGTQVILMNSLEGGLGNFVLRLLSGAVAGERRTVTAEGMSTVSVSRTGLSSIVGQDSALLLRMQTDSGTASVEFHLPVNFGDDVFGGTMPLVDVEISLHGVAPAAKNRTIVSALSGLSILSVDNATQSVKGLTDPILITVPLNTHVGAVFASQLDCVFWNGWSYSSEGCFVKEVIKDNSAVTAVTCGCTHLTTFAVSYNNLFDQVKTLPENSASGNKSNFESTAAFLSLTSPVLTTSSFAGTLYVSFNITGSFGTVTSFETLLQQKALVSNILTQSISSTLVNSLHQDSLTIFISTMCWGAQCVSNSRRRDHILSKDEAAEMTVDFEIYCKTLTGLAQASTAVTSGEFCSGVAHQMSYLAALEHLGNWSVTASMPHISVAYGGGGSVDQRPNIKYNSSIVGISAGSSNDDIFGQAESNIPLMIGVSAALGIFFLVVGYCIFHCYSESKRRQRLKPPPEEVKRQKRKSLMDNRNMIIANYPDFAAAFIGDSGENGEDGSSESQSKFISEGLTQPTNVERSETPVLQWRDSGISATVQDMHLSSMDNEILSNCPPPLNLDQSISGDTLTMHPEVKQSISVKEASTGDLPEGAELRLKHARTKLATLQRRLDRFIEEAARSGPSRPKLPGSTEEPSSPQGLSTRGFGSTVSCASGVADGCTSPSKSQSPVGGSIRPNQLPLLLVRPNPPDLGQRDALTSTNGRVFGGLWPPSIPPAHIPPPAGGVPVNQLLRPAAPLVGLLAQRLHLLAGADDLPPPPPPTTVAASSTAEHMQNPTFSRLAKRLQLTSENNQQLSRSPRTGVESVLLSDTDSVPPPPFRPERVRPRVWHITSPLGPDSVSQLFPESQLARPAQQPEITQTAERKKDSDNIKDPAFLETQL